MIHQPPFPDFVRFVEEPLRDADTKALDRIRRLFDNDDSASERPFAFLLQRLTGKALKEPEAKAHWQHMIAHKANMEAKLGRTVSVQTSAVDYFHVLGTNDHLKLTGHSSKELEAIRDPHKQEDWLNRAYSPSYYLEKLKEEVQRAKRYNHALAAIMLDVDEFHRVNEEFSEKLGDEILTLTLKIVKKTIRNVDIISRYAGDVFLIILPDTNKREAAELAERIRQNIQHRTSLLTELTRPITATFSVAQAEPPEQSVRFARRLETGLKNGKDEARNAVYVI